MLNHGWIMDTDMILCSSLGPDITMTLTRTAGDSGNSDSIAFNIHIVSGSGTDLKHHTAFSGNKSLGHQCRHWLWQDHGPKHGLGHNLGSYDVSSPGGSTALRYPHDYSW